MNKNVFILHVLIAAVLIMPLKSYLAHPLNRKIVSNRDIKGFYEFSELTDANRRPVTDNDVQADEDLVLQKPFDRPALLRENPKAVTASDKVDYYDLHSLEHQVQQKPYDKQSSDSNYKEPEDEKQESSDKGFSFGGSSSGGFSSGGSSSGDALSGIQEKPYEKQSSVNKSIALFLELEQEPSESDSDRSKTEPPPEKQDFVSQPILQEVKLEPKPEEKEEPSEPSNNDGFANGAQQKPYSKQGAVDETTKPEIAPEENKELNEPSDADNSPNGAQHKPYSKQSSVDEPSKVKTKSDQNAFQNAEPNNIEIGKKQILFSGFRQVPT